MTWLPHLADRCRLCAVYYPSVCSYPRGWRTVTKELGASQSRVNGTDLPDGIKNFLSPTSLGRFQQMRSNQSEHSQSLQMETEAYHPMRRVCLDLVEGMGSRVGCGKHHQRWASPCNGFASLDGFSWCLSGNALGRNLHRLQSSEAARFFRTPTILSPPTLIYDVVRDKAPEAYGRVIHRNCRARFRIGVLVGLVCYRDDFLGILTNRFLHVLFQLQ